MAYGWCSVILENHSILGGVEDILFLSLEIGFHHLNPEMIWIGANPIHTEYHWKLASIVFNSRDSEAIADLLHA